VFVSLYDPPKDSENENPSLRWNHFNQTRQLVFKEETLFACIAEFNELQPDTLYFYRIWKDEALTNPLDLQGLNESDLFFRTLPEETDDSRLDFLLMSCHNPTKSTKDEEGGFKVWKHIPEILRNNEKVHFALLAGDQVYADDAAPAILKEADPNERIRRYVEVYKEYWSNPHYRRVLCSLPSILMWDDHDIIDGWGSVDASYTKSNPKTFRQNWLDLKAAATKAFQHFQASRNPPPLSANYADGFDTCFRVGGTGFVMADLRSNRDKERGQLWDPKQFASVKAWVKQNREALETLFFITPVTFAHGNRHKHTEGERNTHRERQTHRH